MTTFSSLKRVRIPVVVSGMVLLAGFAAAMAADRKTDETKEAVRVVRQTYEGPGTVVVLDNGAMIINRSANLQNPDPADVFIVIGRRDSLGLVEASEKEFTISDRRTATAGGGFFTAFVSTDEQSAEGNALLDLTGELKIDASAHRSGEFTVAVTITAEDGTAFFHQWLQSNSPLDRVTAEQEGGVAYMSGCSVTCDNGTQGSISCNNESCYATCRGRAQNQVPVVGCGTMN